MHLEQQELFQYHLIASKPPNAGEPMITANVTTIPKATITMPKRLFMKKTKRF